MRVGRLVDDRVVWDRRQDVKYQGMEVVDCGGGIEKNRQGLVSTVGRRRLLRLGSGIRKIRRRNGGLVWGAFPG